MSGFILANLHSIFLDKLDWKSYYRIQQTCRDMGEFIRMHKKTSTSVPKELYVLWLEDKDGSPYLKPDSFPDKSPHNLESLYGVRLTQFGAELETDKDFEGFCAQLKKYRVTCELLHVFFFDQPLREIRGPKKEQYVEMYKILKPSRILMNSAETNLYETIPTWKKLKEIDILMTPGEALLALEAISHLSKITLTVQQNSAKTFSAEQFWRVFQDTIQFLRSTPLSHLRRFQCDIAYNDNMPMSIEERLHNLTTLSEQTNERFVYNFRVTNLGDSNDFNWFIDESRPVPTFFEVGLTPAGGVILFRT